MQEMIKKLAALQCNHSFSRAGKIFKTKNAEYFYDAGTGKVFQCENYELKLIKLLLNNEWDEIERLINTNNEYTQACHNICNLIDKEHILQIPIYKKFTNENKNDDAFLNGNLKQMTLEVTQKCNLRCKYCIYNEDYSQFRSFTMEDMDWDTAKAALDYANLYGADDIIIGFYGGEPLLNFKLVKKSIEYCLKNFKNHSELYFTMTSNLTMMNEEMAEYFKNVPNMNVVCSLDGPQSIQDQFRVFSNNVGSFERTINGLKILVEKMGEQAEKRVSIHSVLCPPFDENKLEEMKLFFQNLTWLPKGIGKNIAYVGAGTLKDNKYQADINDPEEKKMEEIDPVKAWAIKELSQQGNDFTYAFQLQHSDLMRMHVRSILNEPAKLLFRNACCTPGIRKMYVAVDGTVSACERIGNSPSLGNIVTGLDLNKIREKYLQEYDEYSLNKCNECWAMHLCNNCYALCYDENGLNQQKKDQECVACRKSIENDLIEYYQLLEDNPVIIQILDSILYGKS